MNAAKEMREIVSPEGVEERVVKEAVIRITLTGGGRFRVYADTWDGEASRYHDSTVGVFDDQKSAEKAAGEHMILLGGMIARPQETIALLIDAMKNERRPAP